MGFQKKNAVKKEQAKIKGQKVFKEEDDDSDMFEDLDDMDDDDISDSEEETSVQNTPKNKTPKGRQSLSEKKVSFQIPGKNTPAKTPNKANSLLSKKQPTPGKKGKTAVEEFKGIKGKKNQSKQDDDDEEDSDDEVDEDDDDDDDLDLELGGDDDDDEEDDEEEEEEEDDDDDDDSEEEEDGVKNKLSLLKQKNNFEEKQKTPKAAGKPKTAETAKVQTPRVQEKNSVNKKIVEDEQARRIERNAKMLYIGNLPKDTTQTELKTLSSDILDCVMPLPNRNRGSKSMYAFLTFASEKKAEENFKMLQDKKLRGQLINVDFVGEKSKNKKPDTNAERPKQYNMKKLHVAGLPVSITLEMVAKFFPKAYQISFNISPEFRVATVLFETEESASEAYEASREIEIGGQKVTVLHALVGKNVNKYNRKFSSHGNKRKFEHGNKPQGYNRKNFGSGKNMNEGQNPAKRMKV